MSTSFITFTFTYSMVAMAILEKSLTVPKVTPCPTVLNIHSQVVNIVTIRLFQLSIDNSQYSIGRKNATYRQADGEQMEKVNTVTPLIAILMESLVE